MKIHRLTISLTRLFLAWTIIAVTFALGFIAGQKLDLDGFRTPIVLPRANERPQDTTTSELIITSLPLEIVSINGNKLITTLSAGAPLRAYDGPATRTLELNRTTKIFRVTFDAAGLPEVRAAKVSVFRVGQQITISAANDIATLATIQPVEIRILE